MKYKKLLMTTLSIILSACGGANEETSTPDPSSKINQGPVASDAIITDVDSGDIQVGDTLSLTYHYSDVDDIEGTSMIHWLRDDVVIQGASALTYQLQPDDAEKNIRAQITPVANSGETIGTAVTSNSLTVSIPSQKPVVRNVEITDADGGTIKLGDTINLTYDYQDANDDEEGESLIRWSRDGIEIAGATLTSYQITLDDQGKMLTANISPVAKTGGVDSLVGERITSEPLSVPNNAAPIATHVQITDVNGGEVNPGDVLTLNYDYSDADGDLEDTGINGTLVAWEYEIGHVTGYITQGRGDRISSITVGAEYVGASITAHVYPKALTGKRDGKSVESNQRTCHSLVVWKNHLYLLSGRKVNAVEDSNGAYLNDVWRMNEDGNWQKGFQSSIKLNKPAPRLL